MKAWIVALGVAGLLGGCSTAYPPKDLSTQKRIDETLKQASEPKPAPPVALPPAVSQSLLPPLRSTLPRGTGRQSEPRFDLIVTDASIAQILHAVVADTRYSIVLSPKVAAPLPPVAQGQPDATGQAAAANSSRRDLLTVHLKNVTIFEALDALRESYGYEYSVQGTRIFVEPPEMQTRFYQVNYTLGQRRGVSDLQVVAGATMGSSGGGGSGSGSGSSSSSSTSGSSGSGNTTYASSQASALSTMAKSDLWGEIEDSMRTILGCFIPRMQAPTARAAGQGAGGSSSGGTSSRADVSYVGDSQLGDRARGVEGCAEGRAVHVNQMSGTILVRGMPKELRTIERLLRTMQINVERQVSIEAKVVDVQLNRDSQQGINWAAFHHGLMRASVGGDPNLVGAPGTPSAGQIRPTATLGDLFGGQLVAGATQTAFSAGLGVILQGTDFASLISFLETQGDVHVLSSPRIATLNNQKAVIKVGTEEPFVTSIAPGSVSLNTGASVAVPPTLNYAPFFSGISLDVTPQVDDQDRVTLHVHALVNSIVEKEKPSSTQVGSIPVPLAVNSVNETDSVVKTPDGMMVVIGGLMTDSAQHGRSAIPGVGDVPVAGALFSKGSQTSSKRELVILIKPSIIRTGAEWAEDIAATSRRVREIDGISQGSKPD
jgi:MSHA biogenesis protein MshL